jgi:Helix-turn-helix of DDE superfamily endonuclease/DDE superfamily endonuclease
MILPCFGQRGQRCVGGRQRVKATCLQVKRLFFNRFIFFVLGCPDGGLGAPSSGFGMDYQPTLRDAKVAQLKALIAPLLINIVPRVDRQRLRNHVRHHLEETLSGIVYNSCMLTYTTLQDRPREFLAATGLTHAEFAHLLPAFATASTLLYPREKTLEGTPRQRRAGGGATGTLPQMEDKLLFILVFQKTNPLQTMHGLQFQLSQPQTNYWIHHLLPVLQRACVALGVAPERDASRGATSPLALEGAPDVAIDGTERRRQRPTNAAQQQEQYSGKKKTHTDKNILLVNEHTDKVVYLGPTVAGKKHDKKAADEGEIAYPTNATLDKDTGFQGYEPAGVLTRQPKKNRKARS